MLLSLLDVLIGLTVVYLILSTVASLLVELIEVWLRRRGKLLANCVEEMLILGSDAGSTHDTAKALAEFYNSVHIASLFPGRAEPGTLRSGKSVPQVINGKLPSYIPPERFAAAIQSLSEIAQSEPTKQLFASIRAAASANLPLAKDGDEEQARIEQSKALAKFFEESTERFSGWYRRHVKLILLGCGLLLALLSNADTLRIATTLSNNPDLRQAVVSSTLTHLRDSQKQSWYQNCESPADPGCEEHLREEINAQLALVETLGLPLGWKDEPLLQPSRSQPEEIQAPSCRCLAWLNKAVGIVITAFAISLGAPFWFDLLNKLGSVRSAIRPQENAKTTEEKPA
nr:hypothetical protein [Oceanococcus sp. HetDA_MAG_MS8]